MSEYNLKIKVWSRGDDVRVYLDSRFVEHRSEWSGAECVYLAADEHGNVKWKHGFRTGPDTIRRAERNAEAAQAIITGLGFDKITFVELLARINDCLTKGGNFSVRQYEKKYQLQAA